MRDLGRYTSMCGGLKWKFEMARSFFTADLRREINLLSGFSGDDSVAQRPLHDPLRDTLEEKLNA